MHIKVKIEIGLLCAVFDKVGFVVLRVTAHTEVVRCHHGHAIAGIGDTVTVRRIAEPTVRIDAIRGSAVELPLDAPGAASDGKAKAVIDENAEIF